MNPSRPLAVLSLVVATAGCVQPQACTEIGASNGVSVTVQGADQTQDLIAEVCVEQDCATGTLFAGGTGGDFVDLPAVDSTAAVDVRVTVRSRAGVVVVPATTARGTPRKVQPNGPGCEPTAFQAAVTVAAS